MPEQAWWAQIKPPTRGTGPTLNFEYERCFGRPVWPAQEGKQTASQHLDVYVDDLAAALNWAESHGARLGRVPAAGPGPSDD